MERVRDPKKLGFDPLRLARIKPWMQRYVDRGLVPGSAALIARRGELAYFDCAGSRDVEARKPWHRDTVVRMFSMSKPVTSVALMALYEETRIHLDDPIAVFLPEFKNQNVLVKGFANLDQTEPAKNPITVRHLLTHTSGLSYGIQAGPLGAAYGAEFSSGFAYGGLDKMVKRIAAFPLEFEPGERWHYSVATDVIGRIVEVVSGQTLDRFLAARIFEPLGMTETGFEVPDEAASRFASLYVTQAGGGMARLDAFDALTRRHGKVDTYLGGGGLVGTIDDYWRFGEMLRAGGAYRGERILSPRTIKLMASNHLPGDIASMGPATWAETSFHGVGFGLMGSVMLDPAKAQASATAGDYGWGGWASTFFWVSPKDDLVVVYFTQLAPSSALPLRKELRTLVHQALVG